jgi:hypothetical protein
VWGENLATGVGLVGVCNNSGSSRALGIAQLNGAFVTISPNTGMTPGQNYHLQLPSAQGAADQLLANNGSGVLSWSYPIPAGTPASAVDTGAAGQIKWDADYIYVCIATDTWKRASLATW